MRVMSLERLCVGGKRSEIREEFLSKHIDLFFNLVFIDPRRGWGTSDESGDEQAERRSPFILQFQLQLETLDLHFSLSVVFQYFCIWFTMFWGSDIPRVGPILGALLRPKGSHVPDHITVGATV